MTNPTTPFSWQMPTSTDLVTDLPADFETFGQAVATSMADLLGGTTGQVLSKASNTDMDFTWVAQDDSNAIQNAIVDAKGDLITATAADTPARLAVGTNGQTLVADSSTATGLKWATPASSAQNFTLLSTSSLSTGGVSTFTVSSLSGYNQLLIYIDGASSTSANPVYSLRFNGDSTTKYVTNGQQFTTAPAVYGQINQNLNTNTSHNLGTGDGSAGGYYMAQLLVQGANSSGAKTTQITSSSSTTPTGYPLIVQGIYTGTSVISSLSLITSVGTFDSGTMYIYGAA